MNILISLILPIISVICGIIVVVLGFLAYSTDKKSPINELFLGVTVSALLWILTVMARFYFFSGQYLIIWSARASFAAPTILILLLYYFTYYFPVKGKNYTIPVPIASLLAGAIFYLSLFTPFVVENINIVNSVQYDTYGFAYYVFTAYFIILLVGCVFNLVSKRGYLDDAQKHQMYYVLIGFFLSAIGALTTNLIIPLLTHITEIAFLGPACLIFFITSTTYAIFKHHLFNIKVIATEALTFVIWIFLLIQTLVAGSLIKQIADGTLLALVIFFGVLLIRSVIREVEQREKLEKLTQQLEDANVQLVKLDKLKSEFLSFASHQVKSPMAVVKGYASLIADGTYGQASDQVKETAKKIMNSADRMVALVNNILDLRKIEEGKMEYAFADVDVADLTKGIVNELKTIADERKLELKSDIPATPLIVKADKEKLRQVIQNLIDNALKYTETGWVSAEVKVEPGPEPKVVISVSDSGRGMSKELLPKLFEQWSRDSKAAKEIQGTGLGLYIAKEIVTTHGGEIWAESDGEGKGSKFSVRLKLSTSANKPNA